MFIPERNSLHTFCRLCSRSSYPRSSIEQIEAALGEGGRVLLRYSGTEPVARVMVEGSDETAVQQYADELCDVLRKYLR